MQKPDSPDLPGEDLRINGAGAISDGRYRQVSINGAGAISGGKYRRVNINGAGAISGDVECESFTCHGNASINGSLTAQSCKIFGATDLTGVLQAENLDIRGEVKIKGQCNTRQLKVEGVLTISEHLTAEEVKLRGSLQVDGDCNAESFTGEGSFIIGQMLNAEKIEVSLHGDCQAREIGGGSIRVTRRKHILEPIDKLFHLLINHPHGLTAEVIEGDELYLQSTRAKVVRGKKVYLGSGCDIELVEYSESCELAEDARVKEQKQG
ncbi:MAG: hypothetical protein PWQ18_1413 [Clostridia bacterium]|nr:hypothetical protein [Clostridia bacterium]